MTTDLDEDVVRLAKGTNLATVVTLMPGGQPQALPTWIDTDCEHLLVATVTGEQARQHLDDLSRRYVGTDVAPDPIGPYGRIILTIAADTVTTPARYFARGRTPGA